MKPLPQTTDPKIVLVVDDQERNLQVVATVLSMTGYEVVLASSGEQALKRLAARTPDLILLDVLMPEMDGLEVCRQIKADPRHEEVPIIFLSAADDKNLIVQALEAGGVDYVTKPFNKAELLTRVRTHLALKQARDELRNLAEDKDELLGILTHDLQNNLTGTRISAELLRNATTPEKRDRYIDNIIQGTDGLIAFVMEFHANQSAERFQIEPAFIDLHEMLEDALARHEPAAQVKRITIHLSTSEPEVIAWADRRRVTQVLDNLITNALKFSAEGRNVYLEAGYGPTEWVHFTVRDEGPGFTEEDKKNLFHRYGRLSARPTGSELSTGLGLSIVKRLVEGMKGRILLESEAGKGATFTVRLPMAETPSEAAAATS
ncbi:MAG: hybrid sensor histidine kinase/response regulator [Verrucomicrobiaceae bacterium]|nr:hybrid sensor histidine kinase/response regulator [Verrucomicrobiaceae bacterium]